MTIVSEAVSYFIPIWNYVVAQSSLRSIVLNIFPIGINQRRIHICFWTVNKFTLVFNATSSVLNSANFKNAHNLYPYSFDQD